MCDRIETGTMAIAAALTGGILKIKGLDPKIINTELELVKKTGSIIKYGKNEIKIYGAKKIKNIKRAPRECGISDSAVIFSF